MEAKSIESEETNKEVNRTAAWAIARLCMAQPRGRGRTRQEPRRCRIRIPDTVLFDTISSQVILWAYTTRKGYVTTRSLDKVVIYFDDDGQESEIQPSSQEQLETRIRKRFVKLAFDQQQHLPGSNTLFQLPDQIHDSTTNGTTSQPTSRPSSDQSSRTSAKSIVTDSTDERNGPSVYVCVVRIQNWRSQGIDCEPWHVRKFFDLMNGRKKLPVKDQGPVTSIQSVVLNAGHGANHPGRMNSSHKHVYTRVLSNTNGADSISTITYMMPSKEVQQVAGMVRSHASEINAALDEVTNEIVSHLEQIANVLVLKMETDYLIDMNQCVWFLWTPVLVTTSSQDDFFGEQPSNDGSAIDNEDSKELTSKANRFEAARDIDRMAMGVQVGSAVVHIEAVSAESSTTGVVAVNADSNGTTYSNEKDMKTMASRALINKLNDTTKRNFRIAVRPDSQKKGVRKRQRDFRCVGDFCEFQVEDPDGFSEAKTLPAIEIARQLFSKEELNELATKVSIDVFASLDNSNSNDKGVHGLEGDNKAWRAKKQAYSITFKSIALARKEKRSIATKLEDKNVYVFDGDVQQMVQMHAKEQQNQQPMAKEPGKQQQASTEQTNFEEFGPGNYYKQVQVCHHCFKIYSTLDRARDALAEAHNAAESSSPTRANRAGAQGGANGASPWIGDASFVNVQRPKTPPINNTMKESRRDKRQQARAHNLQSALQGKTKLPKMDRATARALKKKPGAQTIGALDAYLRYGGRNTKANSSGNQEDENSTDDGQDLGDVVQAPGTTSSNRTPKLSRKFREEDDRFFNSGDEKETNFYRGRVLIVEPEPQVAEFVVEVAQANGGYACTWVGTGTEAWDAAKQDVFDVVLLAQDLDGLSGVEVVKLIREREKKMPKDHRRLPIVAFTERSAPSDLRLYMQVGMDGCVSKPVDETSLLNTLAAAIPHHSPPNVGGKKKGQKMSAASKTLKNAQLHGYGIRPNKSGDGMRTLRPMTTKLVDSSSVAKLTLPVSTKDIDTEATHGVFQMDADTSLPYSVLGNRRMDSPLFNVVVIHDFFDTYETMEIFFKPLVAKYPGLQVLLFNTPGQAHTEWRRDVVLNNEYVAECLESLIRYVDYNGTGEFHTRGPYGTPFYMLGFGNGGNIATYHALHHKHTNMRASLLINSFTHVDAHLAGILHDCLNVFSCSPSTRPDLPIYFYARFIFSSAYLTRVTTPLALNLYTAVHNPITLEGRLQICKGALAHLDLRPMLGDDRSFPLILVQSVQGGLIKPRHVDPYVQSRNGEVESIRRSLKDRTRPCVIWLKAGHEVFQEARKPLANLLEQLVTGYHEKHDVVISNQTLGAPTGGKGVKSNVRLMPVGQSGNPQSTHQAGQVPEYFEDRFINNVLGRVAGSTNTNTTSSNAAGRVAVSKAHTLLLSPSASGPESAAFGEVNGVALADDAHDRQWAQHQNNVRQRTSALQAANSPKKRKKKKGGAAQASFNNLEVGPLVTDLNPFSISFSRTVPHGRATESQSPMKQRRVGSPTNVPIVIRSPTKAQRNGEEGGGDEGIDREKWQHSDVPEVREYMQWRIARNRKRLARLDEAARIIQRARRAYVARTIVLRMRQQKAALFIQRNWRGKVGRARLRRKKSEDWAARLVQRAYRGRQGRLMFWERREQVQAASDIQRLFRGRAGKQRVNVIKAARERGAKMIQKIFRGHRARGTTWRRRKERNAGIEIQRVFRGWQGRTRAILERERFLFSKAQSQGIDFGRQMLLEHKLHGTRLQSEVSLLTKEKAETEEKVEALLSEIAEFDEGVLALEREMHELSKVETEAKSILDEEAKVELREQKMRLDREFGVMLGKIGDRKERLRALESKLQTIDRTRQTKEEELRDLERKLVVLLEEQQMELEQIKKRQEKRGELVLNDNVVPVGNEGVRGGNIINNGGNGGGHGVGGHGYSGPTPQQQEQANSLMQSTESLMKFGFMSMSMTYFSSLNMVRAMRKVGAINTVLNGAQQNSGLMDQLVGKGTSGDPGDDLGKFKPKLNKGEMPGQEKASLAVWSVQDVGDWLASLTLGQYRTSFADAAIDGAFLCDLNDDDLRNTLGIEHNLHRKKLLNSIYRLQLSEHQRASENGGPQIMSLSGGAPTMGGGQTFPMGTVPQGVGGQSAPTQISSGSGNPSGGATRGSGGMPAGEDIRIDKLMTVVRHGKSKDLKKLLKHLPERRFDPKDVAQSFVEGFGTQYTDEVEREAWHINKADEFGNSLLTTSAQNGHKKIADFLVNHGANVNHQNNQGQTALHYAMAYSFFELGSWLADSEGGGGADDSVLNMYELTPYDGLAPE